MNRSKPWSIGGAAREAGVTVSAIRYYEKRGLLATAPRSESGYRKFSLDDLRRLRFIRKAQALGFTLEEIRELILLSEGELTTCGDVQIFALTKKRLIDEKIRQLEAIRGALDELAAECPGSGSPKTCPILENLERDEPEKE